MIEINYFTTRAHFLRVGTSKIAKKIGINFKKFLNTIEINMSQNISAWIRVRPEPEKKKTRFRCIPNIQYATDVRLCSVQRRIALCTLCFNYCLARLLLVHLSSPTLPVPMPVPVPVCQFDWRRHRCRCLWLTLIRLGHRIDDTRLSSPLLSLTSRSSLSHTHSHAHIHTRARTHTHIYTRQRQKLRSRAQQTQPLYLRTVI